MLNLFKHQWLPDYIREYIVKKFPTANFKVTFEINGRDVPKLPRVGKKGRGRQVPQDAQEKTFGSDGLLSRILLGPTPRIPHYRHASLAPQAHLEPLFLKDPAKSRV